MAVRQTILSAVQASQTRLSASLRRADDAAHDFCVPRFGNVADEQHFLGSERFARLGGEHVF